MGLQVPTWGLRQRPEVRTEKLPWSIMDHEHMVMRSGLLEYKKPRQNMTNDIRATDKEAGKVAQSAFRFIMHKKVWVFSLRSRMG